MNLHSIRWLWFADEIFSDCHTSLLVFSTFLLFLFSITTPSSVFLQFNLKVEEYIDWTCFNRQHKNGERKKMYGKTENILSHKLGQLKYLYFLFILYNHYFWFRMPWLAIKNNEKILSSINIYILGILEAGISATSKWKKIDNALHLWLLSILQYLTSGREDCSE